MPANHYRQRAWECLVWPSLLCLLSLVAASRTPQHNIIAQKPQQRSAGCSSCDGDLNTYFWSTYQPQIKVVGPGREGTTRLQVQLRHEQVSSAMPVVTASMQGVSHDVANTWSFLKNYALQSELVAAVNQQTGFQPHLYPIPAVALQASSALSKAAPASITHYVQQAEAAGQRHLWTHTAPTNVLLLPEGLATGAIADIMSVTAVDDVITLTLDAVHKPHIISELQDHPKQTLDDDAHYHFFTPAGVTVDAQAFLAALAAQGGRINGLHVFAKGFCTVGQTCRPQVTFCDVPEICYSNNGIPTCPPNGFKNPGSPCTQEDGTKGQCDGAGACVPLPCTPGVVCRAADPDSPCDAAEVCQDDGTCPADDVKVAGTWCRKANSTCEVDTVCNGKTKTCPVTVAYNGRKCTFTPPSNATDAVRRGVRTAGQAADYDLYKASGLDWPPCKTLSTCLAGECVIDESKPGCCYLEKEEESYGYEQGYAKTAGGKQMGELYCWEAAA